MRRDLEPGFSEDDTMTHADLVELAAIRMAGVIDRSGIYQLALS